jgi:hypothetical protein
MQQAISWTSPFLFDFAAMRRFHVYANRRRSGDATRALPVPAMPAVAMPAPMSAVPVPMPVMSPAHFLRRKTIGFLLGGHGRTGVLIRRRQPAAFFKRMRRKRCGLRSRGQRGGARGKSKSEFQKVTAFHDISSSCMARDAGKILIAPR